MSPRGLDHNLTEATVGTVWWTEMSVRLLFSQYCRARSEKRFGRIRRGCPRTQAQTRTTRGIKLRGRKNDCSKVSYRGITSVKFFQQARCDRKASSFSDEEMGPKTRLWVFRGSLKGSKGFRLSSESALMLEGVLLARLHAGWWSLV